MIALSRAWHSIKKDFSSWEQHTFAAIVWWMLLVILEHD